MQAKRHEVIDDIICTMTAVINENLPNPDVDLAELIANKAANLFTEKWAKTTIYIPEDVNYKAQLRNCHIWSDYQKGTLTIQQIASKNKCSVQHVYKIIREMRDKRRMAN